MSFKFLEHQADVGIQAEAKSLEKCFEEGARALFSYMVEDLKNVDSKKEFNVEVSARETDLLFVEWLNYLLYLRDAEGVFLSKFKIIQIKKDKIFKLNAKVYGETINIKKHKPRTEVKAATYSGLKFEKKKDKYLIRCVLDI